MQRDITIAPSPIPKSHGCTPSTRLPTDSEPIATDEAEAEEPPEEVLVGPSSPTHPGASLAAPPPPAASVQVSPGGQQPGDPSSRVIQVYPTWQPPFLSGQQWSSDDMQTSPQRWKPKSHTPGKEEEAEALGASEDEADVGAAILCDAD